MRIGQILFNAITDEDPHNKVFYIENNRLVASVARYGRVTEYRKILRTKRT